MATSPSSEGRDFWFTSSYMQRLSTGERGGSGQQQQQFHYSFHRISSAWLYLGQAFVWGITAAVSLHLLQTIQRQGRHALADHSNDGHTRRERNIGDEGCENDKNGADDGRIENGEDRGDDAAMIAPLGSLFARVVSQFSRIVYRWGLTSWPILGLVLLEPRFFLACLFLTTSFESTVNRRSNRRIEGEDKLVGVEDGNEDIKKRNVARTQRNVVDEKSLATTANPASDKHASGVTGSTNEPVPDPCPPPVAMRATATGGIASFPVSNEQDSFTSAIAAAAASFQNNNKSTTAAGSKRYVEILVHNVSHTDIVFGLENHERTTRGAGNAVGVTRENSTGDEGDNDDYCLCRPRFSCFDKYSNLILQNLDTERKKDDLVYFPCYERDFVSLHMLPMLKETRAAGFRLERPVDIPDINEVRLRGRDHAKVSCGEAPSTGLRIRHVFFPLVANLLPRWQKQIQDRYPELSVPATAPAINKLSSQTPYFSPSIKRVLILVSGVGTPRNWTHDPKGNSTKLCSHLLKQFCQRLDPSLAVVTIHSETNLFRYDENLVFVERELMPKIHSYRDAHARGMPYPDEQETKDEKSTSKALTLQHQEHEFSPDWRKSFHTTLSFADGSNARTYVITTALRQFRPTYFHVWQLKTFWHECKISQDDIEVHSFEAMETLPAVDVNSCTNPDMTMVIADIQAFKQELTHLLEAQNDETDIRRFWLRKTQKPVVAVLLVELPGGIKKLYRGTNMEVSMPTGSLCAERNVIGTALADNPQLKRQDLKLIAVLAVPMPPEDTNNMKRTPSNVSLTNFRKGSVGSESDADARKFSVGSEYEDAEWVVQPPVPSVTTCLPVGQSQKKAAGTSNPTAVSAVATVQFDPDASAASVGGGGGGSAADTNSVAGDDNESSATPLRHISLFPRVSSISASTRKRHHHQPRTVILRGDPKKDINPLRPCGACNEWLKKIAECNPYFKILTFTDANCNGVYVTPIQEE